MTLIFLYIQHSYLAVYVKIMFVMDHHALNVQVSNRKSVDFTFNIYFFI